MSDAIPRAIVGEFEALRAAARELRQLSGERKNQALRAVGALLASSSAEILQANADDLANLSPETTLTRLQALYAAPPEVLQRDVIAFLERLSMRPSG
mgnify:CR=1 FL=1